MTIERKKELTVGMIWPYLVTRPSFRNLKPRLGRPGTEVTVTGISGDRNLLVRKYRSEP